ncbi:tyrosine-type recombinase/integrase [Spirillospora sp. CA-253888]
MIYDLWHAKEPRIDAETGEPVPPCAHSKDDDVLYPSLVHGKGKRWQVRWRDLDGKQCKRNFDRKVGKNPNVHAEAYDKLIQGELATGAYIDPSLGEIRLSAFAQQWRKDKVGDPATLEVIDQHLAHIYDADTGPDGKRPPNPSPIGEVELRHLEKRPSLIQTWVKFLQEKELSPQYIKLIAGTLSSIFKTAVGDGRMRSNPFDSDAVTLPTIPVHQARPWTPEMVNAARTEVDHRHKSPAIVDLAVGAGVRQAEVFAVALEDIAFPGNPGVHDSEAFADALRATKSSGVKCQLKVRRQIKRVRADDGTYHLIYCLPKGGKERSVPLSATLAVRVAEQIKKRPPVQVALPWGKIDGKPRTFTLLFVKSDGLPWYRQTFAHTWRRVREVAGAPPPPDENGRFHGLRHTYASTVLAAGADIRKLAAWLGHKDPGFTLRTYIHLMPDAGDVGRKAIDAFFEGGS